MDDFAALSELTDQLNADIEQLRAAGVQLAKNEAAYRKELRVAILKERAGGTPVTIVGDVCRGMPSIADLKLARDSSEAIYKAAQEAVNVHKLQARIIENQIAREWSQAGRM